MVTICLQCGDVGYDYAYVYCVKCLKFAVHRYCLPEIPKTFDEFVDWVCDNCEAACSGSAGKKAQLSTRDGGRCTEHVIFASTSGSNKKIVSQSSPGKDESNEQRGRILQSVHENPCSSGDVRVTDDCYLSGAETNANTNWSSQKESIPTKHEHQRDTSRQLDGVEEVKVATDDSIPGTNLRKKTEVPSVVCRNEKQKLPSTSYQKIHYGERQSDTYQRRREEDAEVASKFSEQTRFRKNSDISSFVPEKEQRRQATSNHFNIAYQKKFDDAPARSSSAEGSSQRSKFAVTTSSNQFQSRNELKKDRSRSPVNITKQRYNGCSSEQTHEARTPHNIVRETDKGTRSNVNKEVLRQTHESRRHVHYTVRERDRVCSKEKAVISPSRSNVNDERQIHEARMPHNIGREREKWRLKEESLADPTRSNVNKEVSRQTHESRRHVHYTVRERDRECSKEKAVISPTRSNVNDERQIHEARMLHNIVREREKGRFKEESLAAPTRSNVNKEVSRQTHESRRHVHYTVRERDRECSKEKAVISPSRSNANDERQIHEARMPHNIGREREKWRLKEESLADPTRSNVNKEVSRQTHESRRHVHNTVRERERECSKGKQLIISTRSNVNYERQIHESKRPVDITARERGKEQVKEKAPVIRTRSNAIEEAFRYPLTTPPIAGPSGNPSQVQPRVAPTWRGKFDFVNKKYNIREEVVAHLSSRACQQVIEEVKQLPALLPLEMVPKSAVWLKSFQRAKPTDDSIALYIFPADRRYEKEFDNLVEKMSRNELAMRTTTNNAELLIFSSTELPNECCRYKNKCYIWGVFKTKQRRVRSF